MGGPVCGDGCGGGIGRGNQPMYGHMCTHHTTSPPRTDLSEEKSAVVRRVQDHDIVGAVLVDGLGRQKVVGALELQGHVAGGRE